MQKTEPTPSQQNLSDSRKPIDHHRHGPQPNAAHPSMPRCLDALMPFRKNKAKSKLDKLPYSHTITHTPRHPSIRHMSSLYPSVPRCPGPLVPAVYEKQTQSTPFYMDSGVVPSEWSEPRELPSNGQT